MEIKLDDKIVLTLSETQVKILMHDISSDIFEEDIARRLKFIIMEKYQGCVKRIRQEWEPKLKELGKRTIPLDEEKFCEIVFECKGYADKKIRLTNGE